MKHTSCDKASCRHPLPSATGARGHIISVWPLKAIIIDRVSLDTQVFVTNGFCFNSKAFEALRKLIAYGRLALVMTDITLSEIRSRIRKTLSDEFILPSAVRQQGIALHNSSLPEVQPLMTKLNDERSLRTPAPQVNEQRRS